MVSDNHDALDRSAGVSASATLSIGTGGQQVTPSSAAVTATMTATVGVYGTLTVVVRRFYDKLLETASVIANDPAADSSAFGAAIALAGTAAEVAAGTAITTVVEEKHLGPVAEAAVAWIWTFNLAEQKVRDTWNAVTGDTIHTTPFWSDFGSHVKRRNKVVHTGTVDGTRHLPTSGDAEQSIEVKSRSLLRPHQGGVLRANGLGSFRLRRIRTISEQRPYVRIVEVAGSSPVTSTQGCRLCHELRHGHLHRHKGVSQQVRPQIGLTAI